MPFHPKVVGSTAGALAGAVLAALIHQCGGAQAVLVALLPVVFAGAAGWSTPPPKAAS